MNNQLSIFLIYVVSGIAIGIFFDVFRILRKTIKTSNTFTYIEDSIFCIIVGIFLIWEIFTVSYGELRLYIFIGIFLGLIIHFLTISKMFIKVNVKIFDVLKKFFIKILNIIKKISKPIIKPIYFIIINFSKNIKKLNKILDKKIIKSSKKEGK